MHSSPNPWSPPPLEAMSSELPAFLFESLLGRGGMGAVFLATEISLDRKVAVKILPADLMEDAEAFYAERFHQEARTMARLNHPGVVRVFDHGRTPGGLLYIVMEYVDGTDLARLIAESGRLPPERALDMAEHLCRALEAAHAQGIIHRDIKPANLLLTRDGKVKIADFGLAKQNDAAGLGLTRSNVNVGTPDYLAPEAWTPGTQLDARADVFAAGVVLYQMLTGAVPRGLWKSASELAGTDARCDAVIDKAMQPERDARYASAAEMLADLAAIRSAPAAPVPVAPRRRWWIIAAAAFVTIGVAVTVIDWFLMQASLQRTAVLPTHVTTAADAGPGSLRAAMENCDVNPGPDTITFDASLSGQTIQLTGRQPRLALGNEPGGASRAPEDGTMTLDGSSGPGLVLSSKRGFFFHSGDIVSIRSVTITGLDYDRGAAIANAGHLTLSDCTLTGNQVGNSGGAIDNLDTGELELLRCTFTGNTAASSGGAIRNRGRLTATDCTFRGNRSGQGGAVLQEHGTATFTNCRFRENEAASRGGALALAGGTLTATRCTFAHNTVAGTDRSCGGGGLYIPDGATLHLDACLVAENSAPVSPDIWTHAGILTARRCWIGASTDPGLTDGRDENRVGTTAAPLLEKDAPPGAGAD